MGYLIMWTLESGISFIRSMEEIANQYNYHLTLGGSVLHRGESNKDLDIYAMPFHNDKLCDESSLLTAFMAYATHCEPAFYSEKPQIVRADNLFILRDSLRNLRIDLFVIKRQK